MSDVPAELKYTTSHEWVRDNGDGTVTVGISDHAQDALGDLVFFELPEMNESYEKGDAIAVAESVKAASDIYAPISGEVVAINEALDDAPETVNESPYEDGWIFSMKVDDISSLDDLLDAGAYTEHCAED